MQCVPGSQRREASLCESPIAGNNQHRGKKCLFHHSFRDVSTWSLGTVVSRPVSKRDIMAGSVLERPLTEQEEGLNLNTPYKNISSVTPL